jgi:hypothetical protein
MTSVPIPEYPFPNPYNHRIMWTPFHLFIDLDIVGHMILNEDKTRFKIMLFEQFNGDLGGYYRGQNKDYPTFMTSWQKLKTPLEKCIGWMQKEEFIDWFIRTPYFEHFATRIEFAYKNDLPEGSGAKFCFDFDAIAQHYEFPTNYLDITTKRDIAEFFAYTYKDEKTGKYKPVEDFNKYHPVLYSSFASNVLNNPYNNDIRIVGFQPLLRPILQYAMAINYEDNLIDYNKEFHKIELPQEKEKSFEVFDKFEGGKKIFPDDDCATFAANLIREQTEDKKILNPEIFMKYCKEFNQNLKDIKNRLIRQGYRFSDKKVLMTKETLQDMQKHIDEKLIPWINEFVTYSPII